MRQWRGMEDVLGVSRGQVSVSSVEGVDVGPSLAGDVKLEPALKSPPGAPSSGAPTSCDISHLLSRLGR